MLPTPPPSLCRLHSTSAPDTCYVMLSILEGGKYCEIMELRQFAPSWLSGSCKVENIQSVFHLQ